MLTGATLLNTSNEWTAACEVQQRSMQHFGAAIDNLDYDARCIQLHELGGDFYDFVPLPDKRLALAIGDASGKGLAAALMISSVQSSLRTAASFTAHDVARTLRAVNRQVHESSTADRYATLFYGVFDQTTGTLRYVNAGHPPPIVVRRDGSIVCLKTGGAPVGMFSDWIFDEGTVRMRSGDTLIACTDGVVEAESPHDQEWGLDGIRRAASEIRGLHALEIVDRIFDSMFEFSCGSQTDDATVLVLRA
jgi:sigma-B regulation protein RsbU (phosphoserine phosphatase)